MASLSIPSISTPEYKVFQRNFQNIILHVQGQLDSIRVLLFQEGYIHRSHLDNTHEARETKAIKLMNLLLAKIQLDPRAFHRFIEILKNEHGRELAQSLQECYESQKRELELQLQPLTVECPESQPTEFTSERGCPDVPDESFPYLDLSHLSSNEKHKLKIHLRLATKKIITKFTGFVGRLRSSLDERRVPLGDIKFAILNLVPYGSDSGVCEEIRAAKLCSDVFPPAHKYISFFNYSIIEDLVAKFGSNDDKTKWDEYIREFNTFCKRSIFEVPPTVYSNSPPTTGKDLYAKCDERYVPFTLETVLTIKEILDSTFNLTSNTLQLVSITEGCVELRFSISTSVADHIFPISDDQCIALGNIGIKVFTKIREIPEDEVVSKPVVDTEDHIKRSRKIKAAVETPESLKKSIKWSNHHGATSNGATGDRDVLIIVSKVVPTKQNPHIVPRKPKDSLSEGEKKKLKEQGILNKHHDSDLSVMMERYRLDPDSSTPMVLAYEKNTPSRQEVIEKVIDLMKNTNKSGIVLHYIGPGDAGTGDWCLKDGLIEFREIMELYTQYFKGRVLTIISDCSHSGRWVKEAMKFMDEHGVGPCGHAAKQKDIFIKVYTSCQPEEIPTEFAFSTHCAVTNKKAGNMIYRVHLQSLLQSLIPYNYQQDPSGLDLTGIRCDNNIFQSCTVTEDSNWEKWSNGERIYMIKTKDQGIEVCCYIVVDNQKHDSFMDAMENGGMETMADVHDYGHIKLSVEGKNPPIEISKYIAKNYSRYYNCGHL